MRGGVGDAGQGADLAHGQVGAPVHGDQQYPVRQAQCPLPARTPVSNRVAATLGDQAHQRAELGRMQSGEGLDPLWTSRADHLHHNIIDERHTAPSTGLRAIP